MYNVYYNCNSYFSYQLDYNRHRYKHNITFVHKKRKRLVMHISTNLIFMINQVIIQTIFARFGSVSKVLYQTFMFNFLSSNMCTFTTKLTFHFQNQNQLHVFLTLFMNSTDLTLPKIYNIHFNCRKIIYTRLNVFYKSFKQSLLSYQVIPTSTLNLERTNINVKTVLNQFFIIKFPLSI